jgi:cytochrome c553
MNASMAGLLKGTGAVVVVIGAAIALVVGVFRFSPDAKNERDAVQSSVKAPAVLNAGATAPAPASTAAPALGVSPGPTGNAAPAGQAAAVSRSEKVRLGTDFSADASPWAAILANSPTPQAGQALANTGNAAAGIAACASCHGAQGSPNPAMPFPALAGLTREYLAKQLTDFRSGERTNPLMVQIAKGLSNDEIGSLAVYYGALPTPSSAAPLQNESDRGRHLHDLGDNALALAACANCHGANGAGGGPLLPRLAGQPQQYLMDQLNAFRNGQRKDDDFGTMESIAKRLSPADSDAVTKFYAAMRHQ